MEKLLLEIGAEEIPAGYIAPALQAMQVQLTEKLAAARIAHGWEQVVQADPRTPAEHVGLHAQRPDQL